PGGGGYNELRIEDRKGQEQIYIHAQKDWDENVEHDQKIRIGHERHDTVEANSYTELKAEEHRTTHADRKTEIRANDHLTVATTQHVKLGTGQFVEAGNEIHYYAGSKVVIDAGMELTAKGGGSWLKLDPSGVTLSGATIKMNSGGAPGTGSGIAILLPLIPRPADTDQAGSRLKPAPAQPRPAITASEPREYQFNIQLQDIPGDEGFALVHTPWRILRGTDTDVVFEGMSDEQGRIKLDAAQQKELSKLYSSNPSDLWLAYPGQQIALRLHLEQPDWDEDRHARSALDFTDCLTRSPGATSPLELERSHQDSSCTSDLYSHLKSKE
ncbi:type VI secretion system tip protein VgrG, partial [Pseudomonas sp. GOM6]|nr:type VI secretion system tip protein VgrG [Pseudomonas sp. GOM6]